MCHEITLTNVQGRFSLIRSVKETLVNGSVRDLQKTLAVRSFFFTSLSIFFVLFILFICQQSACLLFLFPD